MSKFQDLSRGLYEPLLENAWQKLKEESNAVHERYANRGFSIPPGAMYADSKKLHLSEVEARAEVIFNCCCQAYKSSHPKPTVNEFIAEVVDAISRQSQAIEATLMHQIEMFHNQFNIPSFEVITSNHKRDFSSQRSKLARQLTAKVSAFIGELSSDLRNANSSSWHQKPIGVIWISVVGTVLASFAIYLIRERIGVKL